MYRNISHFEKWLHIVTIVLGSPSGTGMLDIFRKHHTQTQGNQSRNKQIELVTEHCRKLFTLTDAANRQTNQQHSNDDANTTVARSVLKNAEYLAGREQMK